MCYAAIYIEWSKKFFWAFSQELTEDPKWTVWLTQHIMGKCLNAYIHQEASISLLSFFIRGRQTENQNHKKLTNLITWTTACSNSVKLWVMLYRATQDGWVTVESLTECGPLEKGMANHFSILALRTPWTVWKGKKVGHWKMNSQVGRCSICYCRSVEK